MSDLYVSALRRLVAATPGGRAEVAAQIHANEQTLYQILSGIPLSSGKLRTVGRDLRERLSRAYPDWLDTPHTSGEELPSRAAPAADLAYLVSELAKVVGSVPVEKRGELVDVLSIWAKHGATDRHTRTVIETLEERNEDVIRFRKQM